ncbi:hypothetical protein ACQCX2_12345 [Propionibacteriaceae bacterium Y1700]|uniref:hypothetical protein n=1 Tax=Microlunatus sp. Y1700 TaxID=3418487 RepID=UPI003DA74196
MAWRDWTTGTKVTVVVSALVSLAVIATFAVLVTRPNGPTPTPPPPSESSSSAPTPTPSPTYECTTAQGSECTKELSEKEAERDKILADAEAGYRAFYDAYDDQLRKGGGQLSKELTALTAKSERAGLQEYMNKVEKAGIYYTGKSYIENMEVSDESPEWPEDSVTFSVCKNGSDWRGIDRKTKELKIVGSYSDAKIRMVFEENTWRIGLNQGKQVDKC